MEGLDLLLKKLVKEAKEKNFDRFNDQSVSNPVLLFYCEGCKKSFCRKFLYINHVDKSTMGSVCRGAMGKKEQFYKLICGNFAMKPLNMDDISNNPMKKAGESYTEFMVRNQRTVDLSLAMPVESLDDKIRELLLDGEDIGYWNIILHQTLQMEDFLKEIKDFLLYENSGEGGNIPILQKMDEYVDYFFTHCYGMVYALPANIRWKIIKFQLPDNDHWEGFSTVNFRPRLDYSVIKRMYYYSSIFCIIKNILF